MQEEKPTLTLTLPLKITTPNTREHWSQKSKRNKFQSNLLTHHFKIIKDAVYLPCTVTLIRQGIRPLDYDNMVYSLKQMRDTLADLLIPGKKRGVADGDPRIIWIYQQKKHKDYALIIQISTPQETSS